MIRELLCDSCREMTMWCFALEVFVVLARGLCGTRWPTEVHCSLVCVETFRLVARSAHFDWLFFYKAIGLIEAMKLVTT